MEGVVKLFSVLMASPPSATANQRTWLPFSPLVADKLTSPAPQRAPAVTAGNAGMLWIVAVTEAEAPVQPSAVAVT